ncbi:unnamed protein product [Cochlearia groenlandica]
MVEIRGRFKRIESVFNVTAARERPPCDNSSGSDHSPEETADLYELVASFIEKDGEITLTENNPKQEILDCLDNDLEDVKERLSKLLEGLYGGDERMEIVAAAEEAGKFVVGDINQEGTRKRQLMSFIRNKGFDAGLCKSRWDRFGKNTAGKYEYVDVICGGGGEHNRYIVETNLAGEFKIARPTKRYASILNQVPRVFVGTPQELKPLVKIMCHEMRRSMKHVGIHVPPWRRNGYMQAKWFGYYKRTSNELMVNSGCDTTASKGCKEEFWEVKGVKVMISQLTVAFNSSGVQV